MNNTQYMYDCVAPAEAPTSADIHFRTKVGNHLEHCTIIALVATFTIDLR